MSLLPCFESRGVCIKQRIIDARHKAHQVLCTLGYKIVSISEDAIRFIPRFPQMAMMRALLNSKLGEAGWSTMFHEYLMRWYRL